jgi:hypothetical protein
MERNFDYSLLNTLNIENISNITWNIISDNDNYNTKINLKTTIPPLDIKREIIFQDKYNCWFDHLLLNKPEFHDYIKLYLNIEKKCVIFLILLFLIK